MAYYQNSDGKTIASLNWLSTEPTEFGTFEDIVHKGTHECFGINSIDISKIDIEILKQAYIDLRLVPTMTVYGDPLSSIANVNEEIGDIMPPDNVVNTIIQKYHF